MYLPALPGITDLRSDARGITNAAIAYVLVVLVVLVAAAAILARVANSPPQASPPPECKGAARCFTGTVTHIVDGDTLDVNDQRIRLALVNTPEVNQAGYAAATDFTADTCPVGSRALVDEDDGQTQGSYGRMIAVVYCGGVNLNAALLQSGHAVILTQFCSVSEFKDESWATACH